MTIAKHHYGRWTTDDKVNEEGDIEAVDSYQYHRRLSNKTNDGVYGDHSAVLAVQYCESIVVPTTSTYYREKTSKISTGHLIKHNLLATNMID